MHKGKTQSVRTAFRHTEIRKRSHFKTNSVKLFHGRKKKGRRKSIA